MFDSQYPNPVIYLVKRAITILRTNGPVELINKVKGRLYLKPLQSHFYVSEHKGNPGTPPPICEVELEFKEIIAVDNDEIDELTEIDELKISKSSTLKRLEEGDHIYIAKHKGRIVSFVSIVTKDEFWDPFFRREFKLAFNEAYCWRGFCVPAFRGWGIWPVILRYCLNDVALKYNRSNALGITLTTNESSIRSQSKIGWVKVGRVGFIEIFGIRFHYLWGREAFKETRRRLLIQNIG